MLQYLRPLNKFALGSTDTDAYARHQASVSRATSWYQQTRTFYDPFEDMTRKAHKQIECPRCCTRIFVHNEQNACCGKICSGPQPAFEQTSLHGSITSSLKVSQLGCSKSDVLSAEYTRDQDTKVEVVRGITLRPKVAGEEVASISTPTVNIDDRLFSHFVHHLI
ncbi:hypothetical protein EDD15DRAFT_2198089 [Pisolithus albus]|nr:hypothetical protein EDD15DRAFT_2198089 [Pisolithus albus]